LWTLVGRCDVEVTQVIETLGIVWRMGRIVVCLGLVEVLQNFWVDACR
jgi:hypothetical protein